MPDSAERHDADAEQRRSQQAAAEPQPLRHTHRHRRPWVKLLLRFVLMVVLPLAAVIYGALWWGHAQRFITTENAYVKSDIIAVAAEISGRVVAVNVAEHQRVTRGDLLFEIDARPYEIQKAAARAELAGVRAEIEAMRARYRGGVQEERELAERAAFLEREFVRQQQLAQRGVATRSRLDEAENAVRMARLSAEAQGERNRMVLAELGGSANIAVEDHPKYQLALTRLDDAELALARSVIRAPADGIASNVRLQVGEFVTDEDPIFSIIESDRVWIEANLKETQLTHVTVGQQATVIADAYPDQTFVGRVASISPATGAEFALLPPQNASGNWVKVVQRLPVRLQIEPQEGQPRLRAGMSVQVSIDTERDRSTRTLVREALAWIGLDGLVPQSVMGALPGRQTGG